MTWEVHGRIETPSECGMDGALREPCQSGYGRAISEPGSTLGVVEGCDYVGTGFVEADQFVATSFSRRYLSNRNGPNGRIDVRKA